MFCPCIAPRAPDHCLRRAAVAAAMAALAGCGGGGGGGDGEPVWSGVTIEAPADAAGFTTDQPTVDVAGRAFVPTGSQCNAVVGTIAAGYRVRWSNAANGEAGPVERMQLNCLLAVSLTWEVSEVPLALGDNPLTVTAVAADGEDGQDTITVRRTADTTPPAATGSTPADGTVIPGGLTALSVDFTEPVDASSGSVELRDETADTVLPLAPRRAGAALDLGLATLPAGHAFLLRVSGVQDRGGNPMTGEFASRFSAAP